MEFKMNEYQGIKLWIKDMAPWLFAAFSAFVMAMLMVYAKTGRIW